MLRVMAIGEAEIIDQFINTSELNQSVFLLLRIKM